MRTKLNTSLETNPLHWKRVKDQLEAYNTKVSSIALRKNIIDYQNRNNYSNEMANIRGVLGSKRLPFQTVYRLKERHDELKKLGGKESVFLRIS